MPHKHLKLHMFIFDLALPPVSHSKSTNLFPPEFSVSEYDINTSLDVQKSILTLPRLQIHQRKIWKIFWKYHQKWSRIDLFFSFSHWCLIIFHGILLCHYNRLLIDLPDSTVASLHYMPKRRVYVWCLSPEAQAIKHSRISIYMWCFPVVGSKCIQCYN